LGPGGVCASRRSLCWRSANQVRERLEALRRQGVCVRKGAMGRAIGSGRGLERWWSVEITVKVHSEVT
jgi:hypothetical protein